MIQKKIDNTLTNDIIIFRQLKLALMQNQLHHLLVTQVASLVVKHVTLRVEALLAILALEGAFIVVDSLVYVQVLFLTEGLATTRKFTEERLGAQVQVHMRPQSYLAGEDLPTAFERAYIFMFSFRFGFMFGFFNTIFAFFYLILLAYMILSPLPLSEGDLVILFLIDI